MPVPEILIPIERPTLVFTVRLVEALLVVAVTPFAFIPIARVPPLTVTGAVSSNVSIAPPNTSVPLLMVVPPEKVLCRINVHWPTPFLINAPLPVAMGLVSVPVPPPFKVRLSPVPVTADKVVMLSAEPGSAAMVASPNKNSCAARVLLLATFCNAPVVPKAPEPARNSAFLPEVILFSICRVAPGLIVATDVTKDPLAPKPEPV